MNEKVFNSQDNLGTRIANEEDDFANIKRLIFKLINNWFLLLVSIIICLGIAFMINRYSPPIYFVKTSILIKEAKDAKNAVSDLLYGEEIFKTTSNIENESYLIKRFSLVEKTVKDLDLSVSYYMRGRVRNSDIYPHKPINVSYDSLNENIPYDVLFICKVESKDDFKLATENEEWSDYISTNTYKFGEEVNLNGFRFIIRTTPDTSLLGLTNEIQFRIHDLEELASSYVSRLYVSSLSKKATILDVSIEGSNAHKEVDFLNTLTNNYISYGLEVKNSNATRTIDFINQQLGLITDSLFHIENRLQNFKSNNNFINLGHEGNFVYNHIQDLEKEKAELLIKNKYLQYLSGYIKENNDIEKLVIPSSIGVSDPILSGLIEKLVSLQLEIRNYNTNTSIENPLLTQNRKKLQELKGNILESINNLDNNTSIALDDIDKRMKTHLSSLQKLPKAEREFINIQRMYNLSETLYMFLLEKRAEASIAKAANSPDYMVVNAARLKEVGLPVQPRSSRNYIVALIIGLLIPIAYINLHDIFNNKIISQEDLQKLTAIPFLGIVGHNPANKNATLDINSKSYLSESFRNIRSNIRYLSGNKESCKTYLITSSISGEGKTFCSNNLAYIFSISGKKTLLLNTDMRKKNSYQHFGVNAGPGLSNYLAGINSKEEIISKTTFDNLYILTSGDIPPNPSELLLNERIDILIKELKEEFDYIFIDTPPLGILSDGLELSKYSDVNIFLARHNYTLKTHLQVINMIYATQKMKNIALIFNDVKFSKNKYGYGYAYGYGYGYGCGYGDVEGKNRNWWNKLNIFNF